MNIVIAVLLILHGMITAAFSAGSFTSGSPVPNPGWLQWWPTGMGHSWLLSWTGLARTPVAALGGLVYLTGGAALIAAGLGLLNIVVPHAWWPGLAVTGAGLCLLMLLVYLHPFYLVGISVNVALLASILWLHWPAFMHMNG